MAISVLADQTYILYSLICISSISFWRSLYMHIIHTINSYKCGESNNGSACWNIAMKCQCNLSLGNGSGPRQSLYVYVVNRKGQFVEVRYSRIVKLSMNIHNKNQKVAPRNEVRSFGP